MNTRFSPSLNGSLHLGHLWMAWLNDAWAKQTGGRFLLRFDDVAPWCCGEDISRYGDYAAEGEQLLKAAGILPDAISFVGSYLVEGKSAAATSGELPHTRPTDLPVPIGGKNTWFRLPSYEGWHNVACYPDLVAARVRADIAEEIDTVIRGEELVPELQLYEYLNSTLGGKPRQMVFLPRLRVRQQGILTTLSKTYGNLQLRDLYRIAAPDTWVARVKAVGLVDPEAPVSIENIHPDPVIDLDP